MRWRSTRSIEPRSRNRPSIAGSGVLCSSRPSVARPKANSKRSGVQSAPSSASRSSQILRSRVIAAISSRHTRSMAGASRSYSRSSTSGHRHQAFLRARQVSGDSGSRPSSFSRAARAPGCDETDRRASADRAAGAAPALRAAPADRPPTTGTDTGTTRIALQRGQRIRPRAQTLRRQHRRRRLGRSDQAVGRFPLPAMPPQPPRGQRALQLRAELVEIARAALALSRIVRAAAPPAWRGRARSRRWRRRRSRGAGHASVDAPASNARVASSPRRAPAFDGADDVEHVERRHARARFVDLDARERQIDAIGGGADRQRSCRRSSARAARRVGERAHRSLRADRRAAARPRGSAAGTAVRPDRARTRRGRSAARAPCGVPTNTLPCRRRGGSCVRVESRGESTSRTSRRRTGPTVASGASSFSTRRTRAGLRNHARHQRSSDSSQSPQICDGGQSAICSGPAAQTPQRVELLAIAHRARARATSRVVGSRLREGGDRTRAETGQPALPAIEPADHRGLDDQILPSPGRAQRAGHSRAVSPSSDGARRLPPQAVCLRRARRAARWLRRDRRPAASSPSASPASVSAPGRATRIRRTAAPTAPLRRTRAARAARGPRDRAVACRDETTPECPRARARARAR